MSYYKLDLLSPRSYGDFVGLGNYIELFAKKEFWIVFLRTCYYTLITVIGSFLFGLLTATILNKKFPGRIIARITIISPWSLGFVVTGIIWRLMFDYQFGTINLILKSLGIITKNIGWLTNPDVALWSVIVVTIWSEFPFATLMILAGLQNIDLEMYDAAIADGASSWQRFWYITLPSLNQVNTIVLILLVISIFKRFGILYTLTGGGPAGATSTLIIEAHFQAFKALRLGYASAISTTMLVFVMIFVALYLSIRKTEMHRW
jgi:multiple sugar transport system permease protein